MTSNQTDRTTLKILSIVEATTINAVAKNVLEFHSFARELDVPGGNFPKVVACLATFARGQDIAQPANEFVRAARDLQVEVEIIPERKRFDLSVLPVLRGIVERQRPDLVVTHSVKSHFLVWRSRLWQDSPWVAFHHGYTTTDLKMRIYNLADRWSLPHARKIVTVCHAFARELAESTGVPVEQIVVQHNSVRPATPPAPADVQSLKTRLGIADGERMVLTVGRLSQEKAHIDLLAAFKHLQQRHPDISSKLIIVGDGPERERLEAAVRADGLGERVVFTGQKSDVHLYYAAADVFALPSHSEGSPNVVLEAMAASLPVVATAVGGVPEILEDNESALLVPVNNPAAMAEEIARLLTETTLAHRLTTNASTLIATRYTPENYVRSLTKLYCEVIDRRA